MVLALCLLEDWKIKDIRADHSQSWTFIVQETGE